MPEPYLTRVQRDCLLEFANSVANRSQMAIRQVGFHLLGSEDLKDLQAAAAMIRAMQTQDWQAASSHNAVAGQNDLILGILLQVESDDGRSVTHWVAMKSPHELLDSAELLGAGEVSRLPSVSFGALFPAKM